LYLYLLYGCSKMLLYLSLFSILVSILLAIYNWRINKNALLVSGIFIIFSTYTITHYFTVYSKSDFWLAVFYANFSPLWYLPGPLLFFYVRSTLRDTKAIKSWKDYLHFLPFLIHTIGIIPYLFGSFLNKVEVATNIHADLNYVLIHQINAFYEPKIAFISRPLFVILYAIYCFYLLIRYKRKQHNSESKTENQITISYKWLWILTGSLFAVCAGFLSLTLSLLDKSVSTLLIDSVPAHLISGILFFLFPTCLILFFPKVLYGMPAIQLNKKTKKPKKNTVIIDNDPFTEVAEQMIAYFKDEKPYLNPEFEISDLSIALQIPQHHIAYCFSSILDTKFTSYRTKMRVDFAKVLLREGAADTLSIDGIGAKSGFPSRSSFYASFKSETGMTPSQYLESL